MSPSRFCTWNNKYSCNLRCHCSTTPRLHLGGGAGPAAPAHVPVLVRRGCAAPHQNGGFRGVKPRRASRPRGCLIGVVASPYNIYVTLCPEVSRSFNQDTYSTCNRYCLMPVIILHRDCISAGGRGLAAPRARSRSGATRLRRAAPERWFPRGKAAPSLPTQGMSRWSNKQSFGISKCSEDTIISVSGQADRWYEV